MARIEQATDFAGQSGQALEEIVATVEHTAAQGSAIAAASGEISRSLEQVNGRVADTAQSMTRSREEMARLMA